MKEVRAVVHSLNVIEDGIAGTQLRISYYCPNCNGVNVVVEKINGDMAEILYEPWFTTCVCDGCKSVSRCR